jgi:hypothetical protein
VASYSVDCSGSHAPTPATAFVTEPINPNARATSGCPRSARAVTGSDTAIGA